MTYTAMQSLLWFVMSCLLGNCSLNWSFVHLGKFKTVVILKSVSSLGVFILPDISSAALQSFLYIP